MLPIRHPAGVMHSKVKYFIQIGSPVRPGTGPSKPGAGENLPRRIEAWRREPLSFGSFFSTGCRAAPSGSRDSHGDGGFSRGLSAARRATSDCMRTFAIATGLLCLSTVLGAWQDPETKKKASRD